MRTLDRSFADTLFSVMRHGHVASPRGRKVKEIIHGDAFFSMEQPVCTLPLRKFGYRFMCAEAAWILSGDNRLATIAPFSKFIWEFSDDGLFYQGAYGPKVVDQLTYVCDVLTADPETRQAVIDVWRPNPRAGRDIPCTLSFQFLIRDGKIDCVQTMRSSDVWLGYPYDAFNASMLTGYVMLALKYRKEGSLKDLKLGTHYLSAGSQHVYEPQWLDAMKVVDDEPGFEYRSFNPYEFNSPQHLIDHLWRLAGHDWNALPDGMFLVNELFERANASRS